jgi:glycosyltransferase involved in cell wall biosynthesis
MGMPVQRRLKTAVVINTFESESGMAGGFVHIFESIKRWQDSDLTVFAPEIARTSVNAALPDAKFVAIPSPDRWTRSLAMLFGMRTLTALFTIVRPLRTFDVVYAFSHFLPDIVPAVCAAPSRMVVQVFHLQEPPGKRPGSFLRNVLAYANESFGMALVRRYARSVVVLNDVTTPELRLNSSTRIFRVGAGAWPMPVNDLVRPLEKRSGVVCVGRIHPTKGVADLVEAWKIVCTKSPNARLTLVGTGDPEYVAALRERVAACGLASSIRFAGFVSEEEKAQVVSAARLFATASKEEGWGIAIAEALALGVPCVSYDLPVFREAFPIGRVAVPVGDVAAFGSAIVALLNDDGQYAALAAQARELGATFSWDSVARIEEEAIASVAFAR